jgi:ribonuclease G
VTFLYKEIVVQVTPDETTVAVLEDQKLMEVYLEKPEKNRLAGNIYQGKVVNVLPGMQAAFVDIGLEKNAFLYVEDAYPNKSLNGEEETILKTPGIRDVLKEGQTLTVQVIKEPLGSKGARVTSNITLPGRFLVLMPTFDYIAISRRIEDETERTRLKEIVQRITSQQVGLIIRTAAAGASAEELREDFHHLMIIWEMIQKKRKAGPPILIHQDLGLLERILRDILTEDISKLVVNSQEAFYKVMEFARRVAPYLKGKVVLNETRDLLGEYNVPLQMEQALKRKVWLDCGGYLVIDEVEALTVIDVNTGKYIGTTNLAETVLKTNLDAAVEIVRQLRLRNIGGIIIVDFIDMEKPSHQQQVLDTLEAELRRDKVKTNVLGITQLGLVQLTRKKVSRDLSSILQRECPYCQGTGLVLSEEVVAIKAKKEIIKAAEMTAPYILVEVHPAVAGLLLKTQEDFLHQLEKDTDKKILIRGVSLLHLEDIKVTKLFQEDQLIQSYIPLKVGEILKVKVSDLDKEKLENGVAHLEGTDIIIAEAGAFLGREVLVEITHVNRGKTKGKIVALNH